MIYDEFVADFHVQHVSQRVGVADDGHDAVVELAIENEPRVRLLFGGGSEGVLKSETIVANEGVGWRDDLRIAWLIKIETACVVAGTNAQVHEADVIVGEIK